MITLKDFLENPSGYSDKELEGMKNLPIEPVNIQIAGKTETLLENIKIFYTLRGYNFSDGSITDTMHITKDGQIAIFSFQPFTQRGTELAFVKVTPLPKSFSLK